MLKSALFLSVLPAVLLSGCEDGSSNLFLGKKPKTVEFKRSVDLAGERISIESFGAEDLFVADTFLVFITPKLDKCYSVFSTTGYRHHGNLVSRGQGPGEFVFPVQPVFTEKNGDEVSVAFYDTNKSALVYLNLTRSLADGRPVFDKTREFREIQGIYKLFPLEEGKMFVDYCDFERLDQHYSVYDDANREFVRDDVAILSGVKSPGNSYLLATSCCFNRRGNRYASAMNFIDQVNFYDIRSPEKSFCVSTSSVQSPLSVVEGIPMPDKMEYYNELRSTDTRLFGLHVNRSRKDWALGDTPAIIHVYDWDGKPVARLNTREKIIHFDVDARNNRLYGMTENEELYVYDLNGANVSN